MREALGLRPYYWVILIGGLLYGALYAGLVDIRGVGRWFADRPEVSQAFADPNFGRADAIILVFSTLFLGPLALFCLLLGLIFVIAVFGGFLLPLVRWLRLPDSVATVLAFASVVAALWTSTDMWLPRSLRLVALVARACRIVIHSV